jgi:hypothetical protein
LQEPLLQNNLLKTILDRSVTSYPGIQQGDEDEGNQESQHSNDDEPFPKTQFFIHKIAIFLV